MSRSGRIFIVLVATCAVCVLGLGLARPGFTNPVRFLWLLVVAVISSRMKLKLPGTDTNMCVNLPFLLLASAEMDLLSAVVIAAVATIAQSVRQEGPAVKPVQMLFNTCTIVIATAVAYWPQHLLGVMGRTVTPASLLLAGGVLFFLVNTASVAGIIALIADQGVLKAWRRIVGLAFPYYVLSTAMAVVILTAYNFLEWRVALVALPVMYGVYRSFQLYFQTVSAYQLERLAVAAD